MKFHLTHGSAVCLSLNKDTATRGSSTFCNGLVFSDQPIKINQRICLELGSTLAWSGGIRVGVTTISPSKITQLPRFAYPDLCDNQVIYWSILKLKKRRRVSNTNRWHTHTHTYTHTLGRFIISLFLKSYAPQVFSGDLSCYKLYKSNPNENINLFFSQLILYFKNKTKLVSHDYISWPWPFDLEPLFDPLSKKKALHERF